MLKKLTQRAVMCFSHYNIIAKENFHDKATRVNMIKLYIYIHCLIQKNKEIT